MQLGETICRLRTQKNMSQSELAEALDVSRQSVSKWETNASVPELGKLIMLSRLFNVSLDELVGMADDAATQPVNGESSLSDAELATGEAPAPAAGRWPARYIAGTALLSVGTIIFIILLLLGGLYPALYTAVLFLALAAPCFVMKKHSALGCCWVLYVLAYAYVRFATGIRFWWAFMPWIYRDGLKVHALIAWGMTLGLLALGGLTLRLVVKRRRA